MEGLVVSDLEYVPRVDSCYSIIPLGVACVPDPGERSWRHGSRESSLQTSLGMGMIEDSLIWYCFARVKFSCVARSECCSTRFYNFLRLCPSSCAPQWRICHQRPHGTGRKNTHFWCLIIGPLTLRGMGSVQDILRYSPLVPIWISLMDIPAVGIIGQRG